MRVVGGIVQQENSEAEERNATVNSRDANDERGSTKDIRNRISKLRANLGLRTATNIFEAAEKGFKEVRARGDTIQRHTRRRRDAQPSAASANDHSRLEQVRVVI